MINSVCGIRSTGRICTDLAQELEKQGHEVKIAYGRESVPDEFHKYAVRIGDDLDVKIHGLMARLFDASGFGSKVATKKFISWVKEFDPDIIHLHNIHGYYINIEVLFEYLKTCGKKIIWTLHDCWAFTGHSAFCDAAHCEKWEKGCSDCSQIKEYPKSYRDNSKANWKRKKYCFTGVPNLTIVTPSHWLAGLVKRSFLKEYPVKVIHNGIDTSKFRPLKNDFRQVYGLENKFILLGVSSVWNDLKGYSDFIKLSSMLSDEYRIVLVGLNKQQIEALPENIIGIEKTNSIKELAYIYSSADLFLNLTYCDNYPTVNLEARACGLPVVTYNTGGSPESAGMIPELTAPQSDLKTVLEEIEKFRGSPEVFQYKYSKEKYDKKFAVADYICEYLMDKNNLDGGYWTLREKYNVVNKTVILGVAAIWDYRKGLDTFIALNKSLDEKYKIILIGLNDQQLSMLPDNIIGIRRTDTIKQLQELYAIADIFLNPTIEDNYPTTNLEAISCGTPVLSFKTGGSPESALWYGNTCASDVTNIKERIDNLKCYKIEKCIYEKLTINATTAQYIEMIKV